MTLYRQIALIVSSVFAVLLVTVISVSFTVIKNSVKQELYDNAQNSVSSLSLSIANTSQDMSNIETMINASFDNGNYEDITFKDPNGEVIYKRKIETKQSIVPIWFEEFVDFEIPVAKSTLSKGWKIIGTIEVLNNKNVAYSQLYEIVTSLFIYITLACLVFLVILYYLFHRTLKPLLDIQKQAALVVKNEFVVQKNLPKIKEFRVVIKSINTMVRKFETIYKNATQTLLENKELMYTDSVSNLNNRKYFVLKASEFINSESNKNFGAIIVISIKMESFNQAIGHNKADEFLYLFSQNLKLLTKIFDESLVCRTNGSEIVVMLPKLTIRKAISIVKHILHYNNKKLEKFGLDIEEYGINIGILNYEKEENLSSLFSKIDYTICQAKLLSFGNYYIFDENHHVALGKNKWKQIVNDGLKNDKFNILYRKVLDTKTNEEIHNVISFNLSSGNELLSYGTLIGPIVELGMIEDVYLHVIEKALLSKNEDNTTPISLQLCSEFLRNLDAYEKIRHLFTQTKSQIGNRMIFEISESLIGKYYENSLSYIKLFKEFGFDFGINNFVADSGDYEYLKKIKPLFIKADKQYLLDNEQNIDVLKIVLDSLDIKLIATGLNNDEELNELNRKGISIISGVIVENIN